MNLVKGIHISRASEESLKQDQQEGYPNVRNDEINCIKQKEDCIQTLNI
jgi:hypothetical protein